MNPAGMLTLDELAERVDDGRVETVLVAFTDPYGRFLGKRFDGGFFLEQVAAHGTHACDYLMTVDMEMNPVPGYAFSNWDRGYGDFRLAPDLATLRMADWLDRTALVLCDVNDERARGPVACAPRSMLRRQIAAASEMGFEALAASELEYYLFQQSYRDAMRVGYVEESLEPAGWYIEDYHILQGTRTESFHAAARRHLRASGIPVECTKGEWGKGQHELNVRYARMLKMADDHAIHKHCLKELADRQGISVTFMAKYSETHAGSSCHIHVSLWRGGEPAFAGSGEPSEPTDVFRWFLGGWMARVPDLMVFYAPTVNSYKRYQPGSWAPTRIAWSPDNRTAGFRVVGHGPSLRIECRIPGADCNPYLAHAAALAAGLDGVRNRTEPPPPYTGNVYAAHDVPCVPSRLDDAVERFESSVFARGALGDDVVDHYAHFYRTEVLAFERAVTDWERRRYFERI
ncbi:MAG: glutamine synthetase [Planctomycetes bacterium]|nr:glutamine synthetase [Planctomycetota bacterium]